MLVAEKLNLIEATTRKFTLIFAPVHGWLQPNPIPQYRLIVPVAILSVEWVHNHDLCFLGGLSSGKGSALRLLPALLVNSALPPLLFMLTLLLTGTSLGLGGRTRALVFTELNATGEIAGDSIGGLM
jgi:hypothetical protein